MARSASACWARVTRLATAEAKGGLAQALANLGGAHSAADAAARDAHTSGFDLAMIVGAVVAAVAAVAAKQLTL